MAKTSRPVSQALALHPRPIGTTAAHAERRAGRVPAVVYGHGAPPVAVSVEARAIEELVGAGQRNHLIDATLDGRTDTVRVRDLQRDPVNRHLLHVDFQRVSRTEQVTATLPVVTVGVARGVKDYGGVLDVVTHALEVTGPADRIPEHIEIDVSGLNVHEHVTAGDVKLPDGLTVATPPSQIVVAVESSRTEAEAAAAPTEPAAVPTVAETSPAPSP